MSRGVRVLPADLRHVHLVACNMRESDRDEIKAGWGKEVEPAIVECLLASHYAYTLFYQLEVLAIYGVANAPVLGNSGEVWCFGTTAIDRHPLPFLRACRRLVPQMLEKYPVLTNLVDINDQRAIKWLNYLDARYVLQPRELGGKLFQQFILAREHPPAEDQCQQA